MHSYSSPAMLIVFYPLIPKQTGAGFKTTDRHQFVINSLLRQSNYQISRKLFQGLITLTDNIICISSLLDPLFITRLRRRKTTFYLRQRLHKLFWNHCEVLAQLSVTLVESESWTASLQLAFTFKITLTV